MNISLGEGSSEHENMRLSLPANLGDIITHPLFSHACVVVLSEIAPAIEDILGYETLYDLESGKKQELISNIIVCLVANEEKRPHMKKALAEKVLIACLEYSETHGEFEPQADEIRAMLHGIEYIFDQAETIIQHEGIENILDTDIDYHHEFGENSGARAVAIEITQRHVGERIGTALGRIAEKLGGAHTIERT